MICSENESQKILFTSLGCIIIFQVTIIMNFIFFVLLLVSWPINDIRMVKRYMLYFHLATRGSVSKLVAF